MSWAETALLLALLCGVLNTEDLLWPFPDVGLQEIKFVLNPVLPLSFPWEPGDTYTGLTFHSEAY